MISRITYAVFKFALIICLCSGSLPVTGQIKHRQLRKEVLESQSPAPKKKQEKKSGKRKPGMLKPLPPVAPIRTPYDRRARIIYLENADVIRFDQVSKPDVQILKGRVKFRHDDAILTCDSAYLYRNDNSIDAYSNVRIVQGDTLFIYGNVLYYNGQTKMARLRGKVRMVNRKTTLTTDSLNYDRTTQLAYYFTGGKIVDPENTLTSVWGQYSTASEDALFRKEVKLVNKNFNMDADTLKYNSKSGVANLVGETHILYQDETDIFTDRGWYDTKSERSMLLNRSLMVNKEGKSLTGDTVFYDKTTKYGEAFGKVILKDTVQKSTLYGNYIYYNEDTELGIATDSALLVDWSGDKHLYVHADTLKTFKDSIYNEAKAWLNVRFYRDDLQGLSDSLIYSSRDSVIHLRNKPVVWQEGQQLSGENIRVQTKNKKVEQVKIQENAITIAKVDSFFYNQIAGKEIIAYVDSGALSRVDVSGNAETVYFVRDDADSTLVGANRTESSFVAMYFKDKKVDRIVLTSASSGSFHPVELVDDGIIYLKEFFWLEVQRPKSEQDVFTRYPAGERPKFTFKAASAKPDEEESAPKTEGSRGKMMQAVGN